MRIYLAIFFFAVYSCKRRVDYPLKGDKYPVSLSAVDSTNYIYPLKDSLSTKDSFEHTNFSRCLLTKFDEPNLSIGPQQDPVYRMLYSSVMDRSVLVTLRPNQIIVKEQIKGYGSPYYDTSKLSAIERIHYQVLRDYFPFQDVEPGWRKRYIDSLGNEYPVLRDVNYYHALLNKSLSFGEEPFTYKTETISISTKTYANLANGINSSDFWDQPYYKDCDNPATDGYGFLLEVNAPERYKAITTSFCPGYSRTFHRAWQELTDLIKRGKRLNLMWQDY